MQINTNRFNMTTSQTLQLEAAKKDTTKGKEPSFGKRTDSYTPSEQEKNPVYKKPTNKVNTKTIEQLKAESEKSYENLRHLVKQLLNKQGLRFSDVTNGNKLVKVDEATRAEAQAAISEGGPLSPENVSDQIVHFAKVVSGGDKNKITLLKDAIDKGFSAAADVFGGTLPEISHTTRELIMEKLDDWANETEE